MFHVLRNLKIGHIIVMGILVSALGLATETADSLPQSLDDGGRYGNAPTYQVALGDLDGDGDLDAVFANMHARSEIWSNDGSGRFANTYQRIGMETHGIKSARSR